MLFILKTRIVQKILGKKVIREVGFGALRSSKI